MPSLQSILICDPLATSEASSARDTREYQWQIPIHIRDTAISFIQKGDRLEIPVASVECSGTYRCVVYVNGLPQSTLEQELVVAEPILPNIYKQISVKMPESQCEKYPGKYTRDRLRYDLNNVFRNEGRVDSMNKNYYFMPKCSSKNKIDVIIGPKTPLSAVMQARSTPKETIQECTRTLQHIYDVGKQRLVAFLMDTEALSESDADKVVEGFPTEVTIHSKSRREKMPCTRKGLYKDTETLVCLPCKAGNRYDNSKKKCVPCGSSSYQDEYGSESCKPCGDGIVTDDKTVCLGESEVDSPSRRVIALRYLSTKVYAMEGFPLDLFCNPKSGEANVLPKWKAMEWEVPSRVVSGLQIRDDKIRFKSAAVSHSGRYTCSVVTVNKAAVKFIQEVIVLQPPSRYLVGNMPFEFSMKPKCNKGMTETIQEYVCPKMKGPICGIKIKHNNCDGITYKGAMTPVLPSDTVFANCLTDRCVLEKVLDTFQHEMDTTVTKLIEFIRETKYYKSQSNQGAEEIDYKVKKKWFKFALGRFSRQECKKGYVKGYNMLICVPCRPGFYENSGECKPCSQPKYSLYAYSYCKACTEAPTGVNKRCPAIKAWETDVKVIDTLNFKPSNQKTGESGGAGKGPASQKQQKEGGVHTDYEYYNDPELQQQEEELQQKSKKQKLIVAAGVAILVLIVAVCCYRKRCKTKKPEEKVENPTPSAQKLAASQPTRPIREPKYASSEDYEPEPAYPPNIYGGYPPLQHPAGYYPPPPPHPPPAAY